MREDAGSAFLAGGVEVLGLGEGCGVVWRE